MFNYFEETLQLTAQRTTEQLLSYCSHTAQVYEPKTTIKNKKHIRYEGVNHCGNGYDSFDDSKQVKKFKPTCTIKW
jgi:hypothetical protein